MKHTALPRNATPIALVALLHALAIGALVSRSDTPTQAPQPLEIILELDAVLPRTSAPTPPVPAAPVPLKPATVKAAPTVPTPHAPAPTEKPLAEVPAADAAQAVQPATISSVNTSSNAAPGPTPSTPGAAPVQLPSSDADYLNNPKPAYPPMSRRLGEQGTVVVRALIGTDGNAQKAEIQQSSGFERLDRAAVETALKWRYVPGKRAGVAEAMWFKVPLRFVLE